MPSCLACGRFENMINKGLFTSKTDEWETPISLFNSLDAIWHYGLDPCATRENAKCPKFYTKEDNGLNMDWSRWGPVFMNPPYGRDVGLWIKKAWETSRKGTTVVCLLPARTDTAWFHDYCLKGKVEFLRGRLRFGGKGPAPFPSMIVTFLA